VTESTSSSGLSAEQLEILRLVESQLMSADEAARILEALDRANQITRPLPAPTGINPPQPPKPPTSRQPVEIRPSNIRIRITDLSSNQSRVNLVLPYRLIDSGMKMVKRMAPDQMLVLDGKDIRRSMEEGFWGPLLDITDDKQRVEIIVEGGPRDDNDDRSVDDADTRTLQ
jgi:hypothetical protein